MFEKIHPAVIQLSGSDRMALTVKIVKGNVILIDQGFFKIFLSLEFLYLVESEVLYRLSSPPLEDDERRRPPLSLI